MDEFLNWLTGQIIAIAALVLGIIILIKFRRLNKQQKRYNDLIAGNKPNLNSIQQRPHLIHHVHDGDRTHAIRNQKLVNHISLYFQNQGDTLFYDNVEFQQRNKRQEVEILAEKELEIFTDPRDSQKVELGESLKITFEREIGESMDYEFKIFFQNEQGEFFHQVIKGEKGTTPAVGEPIRDEPF